MLRVVSCAWTGVENQVWSSSMLAWASQLQPEHKAASEIGGRGSQRSQGSPDADSEGLKWPSSDYPPAWHDEKPRQALEASEQRG